MAVDVYSVVTRLVLEDAGMAGRLNKIAEAMRKIEIAGKGAKDATRGLFSRAMIERTDRFGVSLASVRDQVDRLGSATGVDRLTGELRAAEASATRLSRELANVARRSSWLPGPGGGPPRGPPGSGGRSDHGGRGPFRSRVAAGPVESHFGYGLGDAAGIGIGFGMFEGLKMAAGEQRSAVFAELAAGIDPKSREGRAYAKALRDTAEDASKGTIFSRPDVLKMMPGIAGMSDVPLDQALPFMKTAIQFAETMRQAGSAAGETYSSSESATAAIRLGHLLGITDPEQMKPILDQLLPAALTAHKSPDSLVKVLQYMAGSAAGVGMSQSETMNLGALASIFMPGTRGGTSTNMLLTGLMAQAGPGAGTKIHQKAAARQKQLEEMGLIDPKTHQLFKDAGGGMLLPLVENLHKYYEKNPTQAYGQFVKLFQQRGARIAFELARNPKAGQMVQELQNREAAATGMGGVSGIQNKQNDTLSNQASRTWSSLKTIVDDLAEGSVPGLTAAFHGLNSTLDGARKFLDDHPKVAAGAGYTAEAAALYATWRLGKKFLHWGSRAGGVAAGEAAEGAAAVPAATGAAPWLARALPWLSGKLPVAAGLDTFFNGRFGGNVITPEADQPAFHEFIKKHGTPLAHRTSGYSSDFFNAEMAGMPSGSGMSEMGSSLADGVSGAAQSLIAAGSSVGDAILEKLNGLIQSLAVALSGQVNLVGDVHLTIPGFEAAIGHLIANGLAHATGGAGAAPTTGGRPDFSGGPTLPGPL